MANGIYLYGIFPPSQCPDLHLEGLDHQPVQMCELDDFMFLYSETQQDRYLASRKNLLGHERVLEQVMQQGHPTLLPLQFGLIISDWEMVRQQLTLPKGDSLKQLFSKLEGLREVSIKIFWEPENELELLMQENESLRTERDRLEGKSLSMDQVVKIGQLIEREMEERKQAIVTQFQEALNPLAIEIVENDVLTDKMIYNAAYLIPWDAEPQFGEEIERVDSQFENRLRLRYNNFTAPFNFAQLPDAN
ncbi:MAG: GvpL/GvpF family gas vesicle protein [Oscillatoriophycideae cyanobacterium NC_groundwater_1537_Pr4_S-0.65um_50_18]|nr:GvpL/GvpF family gas vesicle protein [Oscillatoriophycideae cyanobacterium NC_groundwater_1537_Pr4_S-0.65um_50_18]